MAVRLYAVLRLRPRTRKSLPSGLHGERLRVVECAGYALAVADTVGPLEPTVDDLLQFDRVIRSLHDLSNAILPARFDAVAPSVSAVSSEIAGRADELNAALDNVTDCVQMTVRLPAGPARAVRPSRSGKGGRGKGAAYLQTRAHRFRPPALKQLRRAVADLVHDELVEPGPAGVGVYHLIDRRDAGAYLSRLGDISAAGPFPPYAFVPGIDHAIWPGHDNEKSQPADARSSRPRTHRRSARNAHR